MNLIVSNKFAGTERDLFSAVCGALILSIFALPGRGQIITSTAFYGPSSNPTVIVDGSGFGAAPVPVQVGSGLTGDDFVDGRLFFNDTAGTQPWQAGYPTNSLGLVLSSYTPTRVIFGFGSPLSGNSPAYFLTEGDAYQVSINGVAFSGTVDYSSSAVITSTTFAGSSSDPTVIVRGFNFGSAPVAKPVGQGLTGDDFVGGQFYFVGSSWQAGAPGNSLGLNLLSYTPTEVTFGFGSALSGNNPAYFLNESDQFRVAVNGATFDGTVAIPEPSTWLSLLLGGALLIVLRRRRVQSAFSWE